MNLGRYLHRRYGLQKGPFAHILINLLGLFQGNEQILLELPNLSLLLPDRLLGDIKARMFLFLPLFLPLPLFLLALPPPLLQLQLLHQLPRREHLLRILEGHHRQ